MTRPIKVDDIVVYGDVPLWGIVKLAKYPRSAVHQKLPRGYAITCHLLDLPREEPKWVGEMRFWLGESNDNAEVIIVDLPNAPVEYLPLLWETKIKH